jgi:hypothetical protein
MFKLAALALVYLAPFATAASPYKAVFAGNYGGAATLETVTGEELEYNPLRLKISKLGLITGTAYDEGTENLHKITGKINKVTVQYGLFIGKASGKFADGTTWTAEVNARKGSSIKLISGNARQGAFTGTITLTNR